MSAIVAKSHPPQTDGQAEKMNKAETRMERQAQVGEAFKAILVMLLAAIGKMLQRLGHLLGRLVDWLPWLAYFTVVLLVIVLAAYFFQAEGLRMTIPQTGTKLSKLPIPGIEILARYRGWNKLDMACVLATLFALFTFLSWDSVIKLHFKREIEIHAKWKVERMQALALVLAGVILLWDAYLFYQGVVLMGWGDHFALTPVLATAGWVALMVAASVKSIEFQPDRSKKGEAS